MLSLDLIRNQTDLVRRAMARRHDDAPIDTILELDVRRRGLLQEAETLRARRNDVSKRLATMTPKPPEVIQEMRQVGERIKGLDAKIGEIDAELQGHLMRMPNVPKDTFRTAPTNQAIA